MSGLRCPRLVSPLPSNCLAGHTWPPSPFQCVRQAGEPGKTCEAIVIEGAQQPLRQSLHQVKALMVSGLLWSRKG